MGTVVGTAIAEAVQAEEDVKEGRAVRVSFSATREIDGEKQLVTALTSGQAAIPATDQSVIVDFNKGGLSANISVLRDYRGEVRIILDAMGSVLNTECVLTVDGKCRKSFSSYPAREQLLLSPGINKLRVGDYRMTVKVEGAVST